MTSLRIVYVTCCENGLYGLRRLLAQGVEVEKVVCLSPEAGRANGVAGYVHVPSALPDSGLSFVELETYVMTPEHLGDGVFDLLVVNGWNRLIPKEVLVRFRLGGIGVHAGHPPLGLGRAPLPWNILKGRKDIEVYVFRLTERADDGDIVALVPVEITPQDDVRTMYEKVMFQGAMLVGQAVQLAMQDQLRGVPQSREHAVLFPKRTPADGLIDFTAPVEAVYDFIRAQTRPYPGAFSWLEGKKVSIWRAAPFDSYAFRGRPREPGRVLAALPSGIVVQTGTSSLWVLEATCDGQPLVPTALASMEALVGKKFLSAVTDPV